MQLLNKQGSIGCVATIGNFDGVHLGHQAIIQLLREQASLYHLPVCVVTFEPSPQVYFSQGANNKPSRLQSFRSKWEYLEKLGVDGLYCLAFNQKLANFSPEDFIIKLVQHLNIRYLCIGDDFRFGKNRIGDFNLLKSMGEKMGFEVAQLPAIKTIAGLRVSSTQIKKLLSAGDFCGASDLLGRSYSIEGKVSHGAKRGRLLGFPTANIILKVKSGVYPVNGVYIVEVDIAGGKRGVANIGTRPTVDGLKYILEVHLFNFEGDLYGKRINVRFIQKIRDEKRFDNIELLKAQIEKDVRLAKKLVINDSPPLPSRERGPKGPGEGKKIKYNQEYKT